MNSTAPYDMDIVARRMADTWGILHVTQLYNENIFRQSL